MKGLEHQIQAAVLDGFESYKRARSCLDSNFVTTKTTRSNLIHDAIIDQAKLIFTDPQFHFVSASGGRGGPSRKILVLNQDLGLQFKLSGSAKRPCNVSTRAQRALDEDGTFYVGWAGELPIQTVLYELTEDRTDVLTIWIVSHGDVGIPAFKIYDISNEVQTTIFDQSQNTQPTIPDEQEPPRKKRKRFRRPDDEESDGEAGAVA